MLDKFCTIDDFKIGIPLGRGRFGQVWLAKHKETGYVVAIKVIPLKCVKSKEEVKNIRREVEVHLSLEHRNILRMYGYFYDSINLYLVMEYAQNGDLWTYAQDRKEHTKTDLEEYAVGKIIRSVLAGLQYIHQNGIIHRDIKPENILIQGDGSIKLADFGWSVCDQDRRRATFCGTAEYLSPELCKGERYDRKSDMWNVGILCYELCSGRAPITSNGNLNTIKKLIVNSEIQFPESFSKTAIDFISKCLEKNPEKRITVEDALMHPFCMKKSIE